jgi:hypothetical protein
MKSKFSDDEFYAMYKKYKQKYLDLKNSVLEGGSLTAVQRLENIVANKYNSRAISTSIQFYNNEVDKSDLFKGLDKSQFKYVGNTYDQTEINRLRPLLEQRVQEFY